MQNSIDEMYSYFLNKSWLSDPNYEEKRKKRLALLDKLSAPIFKEHQDLEHAIKVSIDLSLNKGIIHFENINRLWKATKGIFCFKEFEEF